MSKCENCIHYEVCCKCDMYGDCADNCKSFKDKSLCVELPCKVGDTLYCANVHKKQINEFKVEYFELDKYANWFILDIDNEYISKFSFERIGELFYLTKEEAEKKLKEIEGE